MSTTRFAAACTAYVCLMSLPALCQSSKSAPPIKWPMSGQQARSAVPPSVVTSVDGPSLGSRFTGYDIKAEIAAIMKSPASRPKSEFESTVQYQTRVAGYKGPEKLAFKLFNKTDGNADVDASYDADSQVLTVDVRPPRYSFEDDEGWSYGFLLKRDLLSTLRYVGSNAFGVKKTITRQAYAEYGVLLAADDPVFINNFFEQLGEQRARFLIRMKPVDAAAVKGTLRAVLVCAIAKPKVFQDTTHETPTIASPYETNVLRQFIPVRTHQLVLFNSISGQVLSRRSPDSWRNESPSTFDLDERPFRIKVVLSGIASVSVDSGKAKLTGFLPETGVLYARERVRVRVRTEENMNSLKCWVNDEPIIDSRII